MRSLATVVLGAVLVHVARGASPSHRQAPEFDIDLDSEPEARYTEVISHYNSSIQRIYQKFFFGLEGAAVRAVLFGLSAKRGPEPDELQREIKGIASLTGLPEYGIQTIQMLYELNTLMVPIENITIPWRGPGCTGIVALNSADGMVYHARNQDFSPASYLQNLVYTGIFKKNGQEVFRAQMIAAFALPLTGMKMGPNGFSFESNTRYLDHQGGNAEMLKNLLVEKRHLNGWSLRKAAETSADYEAFVEALSAAKYIAPEYSIIGGVRKGTILAHNPDGVAHQLVLGQPNYQCRDDYIIVTNFDYWWHDVREWFDYTSQKGLFHPRRIAAQKLLNSSQSLTPEVLFSVIDDDGVAATDTIYQAMMSVEAGLWNVSLPACKQCNGTAEDDLFFASRFVEALV